MSDITTNTTNASNANAFYSCGYGSGKTHTLITNSFQMTTNPSSAAKSDVLASDADKATAYASNADKASACASSAESFDAEGVVYEKSTEANAADTKATYKNPQLVQSLKEAANAHIQQLQDIVNKLLTKQGETWNAANGLKDLYEKLVVDPETQKKALEDIGEQGYWGVEQTSSRIFDFAVALSGGDADKMDELEKAFEKGFKQAEKTWGGQLPEICQKTREEVQSKFKNYREQQKEASKETTPQKDEQ